MQHLRFSSLLLISTLAACGGGGSEDDAAMDSSPLDAGMDSTMADGAPADAGCGVGEIGCPCDGDSCTSGECVLSMCVDCRLAEEGCACRSTGACNAGLRCTDMDLCEACPAGEEACACDTGDTCGDGLVCASDVCVPSTCTEGSLGCPCRGADPECDGTAICGGSGLCETCADDVPGCPCVADACGGDLICEAGSCRASVSCDDLRAAGGCDEFQRCDETAGFDAVCVSMECIADYRWVTATGMCDACVSAGCAAEPSCDAAAAGSIVADCDAENRACEADVDDIGACTTCLAGFAMLADGTCVDAILCEDTSGDGVADSVCGDTEYCDTTNPAGDTCTAWPCSGDTTMAELGDGSCGSCTRSCAGDGKTGRFWPFMDISDQCICETLPGYFWDTGDLDAALCDADSDGWTREEVKDLLDAASPDEAVLANARCDVREIEAVELVDEYGLSALITSCDEGLLRDIASSGADCTVLPLRLFETKRNDVPGNTDLLAEATAYAAGGRQFNANELNGLSKACVSTLGDFDDDGFEDIDQFQPAPADSSALGENARLRTFAHFLELYSMDYAAAGGGDPDRLVISERSRCDTGFALGYTTGDMYSTGDSTSHWRNCERLRDPTFDADANVAGYDFGQWGCDARSGSCSAPTAPAHPTESGALDPDSTLLRDHGLCELGGAVPADMEWRGMNHHSQFKCVQVVADGAEAEVFDRPLSDFAVGGALLYNACQARDCAGAGGCSESTDPMAIDSWDPSLDCARAAAGDAANPVDGTVGWAVVTYQPYGGTLIVGGASVPQTTGYAGGCISEDAEYGELCPSPEFGYCADTAPVSSFGRYRCHGWDSLFLWADDDAVVSRSELELADDAGATSNDSVWNIDPVPTCD